MEPFLGKASGKRPPGYECHFKDHERIAELEAELAVFRGAPPGWNRCVKHDAMFKMFCAGCENEIVLREKAEAEVERLNAYLREHDKLCNLRRVNPSGDTLGSKERDDG